MVRRRDAVRDLARQRSLVLYSLAVQSARGGELDKARSYVERGLKILRRNRVGKPIYYRRWVCKRCLAPLIPGLTASVRLRGAGTHVLIAKRCLVCGWINRVVARKKTPSRSSPHPIQKM